MKSRIDPDVVEDCRIMFLRGEVTNVPRIAEVLGVSVQHAAKLKKTWETEAREKQVQLAKHGQHRLSREVKKKISVAMNALVIGNPENVMAMANDEIWYRAKIEESKREYDGISETGELLLAILEKINQSDEITDKQVEKLVNMVIASTSSIKAKNMLLNRISNLSAKWEKLSGVAGYSKGLGDMIESGLKKKWGKEGIEDKLGEADGALSGGEGESLDVEALDL